MKMPFHLVVWLDHQTARLYELTRDAIREISVLTCDNGGSHIHHKSGTPGPGHAPLSRHFLENISAAIGEAAEILIVGPAQAKTGLKSFLESHNKRQAERVIGVETMGQASLAEIKLFAGKYFSHVDRMGAGNNRS